MSPKRSSTNVALDYPELYKQWDHEKTLHWALIRKKSSEPMISFGGNVMNTNLITGQQVFEAEPVNKREAAHSVQIKPFV